MAGGKPHLYCVINNPAKHGNQALIVNVTGNTRGDKSCQIYIGEHKFIKKLSGIAYWGAETKLCTDIEWEIKNGRWQKTDDFSPEIIERIRRGASVSPDFPPVFLKFL